MQQAVLILDGWEEPLGKGNVMNRKGVYNYKGREGYQRIYMVQDEQGKNDIYLEDALKAVE